ncbi:MAG: FHA domain-containing protein [Chloroflexota bacterium]
MDLVMRFFDMLSEPYWQALTGTGKFFNWYFYGLGGIGGWLIFLLLGVIASIWLMYDSQSRRLSVVGWRFGVILITCLLLPTILYRFTVTRDQSDLFHNYLQPYKAEECPVDLIRSIFPGLSFETCKQLQDSLPALSPYGEYVFYLGLLGGVLAPILAVGYYITFQELVGCPQGHIYEAALGACPECAALEASLRRNDYPVTVGVGVPPPPVTKIPAGPTRPAKPVIQYAWLVDMTNNRRYDLCEDTTRIGRGSDNDIVISDPAISRIHSQIREINGHCTLSDLDSRTGTLLNGKRIRTPQALQNGDKITIGDTVLQFVTAR